MSTIEARLAELGITLPEPVAPVANYVPYVVAGGLAQRIACAALAAGEKSFAVGHGCSPYFFLPSLRRIVSVEYLMPLPL